MTYEPASPFPKEKGDEIRSRDWNDLVQEVQRLDAEKTSNDGDNIDGDLVIIGNVGLGTEDPQDRLDIHGAICFNGDTNQRVYGAIRDNHDAVVLDGNWDELEVKGRVIDWTGTDLYIGYSAGHSNNFVRIGGRTRGVVLHSGGGWDHTLTVKDLSVGIGTTSPSHKLHVLGERIRLTKPSNSSHAIDISTHGGALDIISWGADLYMNNGGGRKVRIRNFVNISSREYKEDIAALSPDIANQVLGGLDPVEFRFKDDEERTRLLGFVSEDAPEAVTTADMKGVNPMAITAVLTSVVKQQQAMIARLGEELEALKTAVGLMATKASG